MKSSSDYKGRQTCNNSQRISKNCHTKIVTTIAFSKDLDSFPSCSLVFEVLLLCCSWLLKIY